jgi:D-3-phosphoglycerate dehydrogenase
LGENGYRVLVKEKIADAGVDLLRRHFAVDVITDMDEDALPGAIGSYDAIVIRSATKLTADVIDRADRLKVIGRAGIGVDNVDVPAATKRGIIVANAPESNTIAAAEHTIAMMLAQARNIPQADASLKSGKWERSKFGGVEVYEKMLGVLGFGRIGQLVAERAKAFGMTVLAYDPFVAAERYRELGAERAESPEDLYERSDVVTIHLPKTPETIDYVNAESFARM